MESFDQISKQYIPMIYKIMYSLSIYRDIDEFYQIGLIALWEASKRYDSNKGNFTSYAYIFIKGRILTELRRCKRLQNRTCQSEPEFWEMIQESNLVDPLEKNYIEFLCQDLTLNQGKWLKYTCLQGLSVQEIAFKESVSMSAVKAWREGAKARLQHIRADNHY